MAPNLNKSPLLFKGGTDDQQYQSPTSGVQKICNTTITAVCQKRRMTEISSSSDQDVLCLDCSEDDLALIGKLSESGDENTLNLSKEEEEELLKSDDEEELANLRHYLLKSRGNRKVVSEKISVKRLEEDLLKFSGDEELMKSDLSEVDTDLEEQLLRSEDEEAPKKCSKDEEKTEGTSVMNVEKSSGKGVFVIDDEELSLQDVDSDSISLMPAEVFRVADAKLVSEELSEDEETVRLTEDGNMVFSEHSDDEDDPDTDFLEEEGVNNDELQIVFVKTKEESSGKSGAEVGCKPSNCALEGVELLANVNDLSAEKGLVLMETLRRYDSCEDFAEDVSRKSGEVLEVDDEVQIIDEDDFKLAMSSDSGDDLFLGDESSKFNAASSVDQQLVDVNLQSRSNRVDGPEQCECELIEDSDENGRRESIQNLPNEECTNECQDIEIVEELSGGLREEKVKLFEVPVSQHVEEVQVSQHVEEVMGSQHFGEFTVTQNVEEISVSQNVGKGLVSQNVKAAPPVPQTVEEILVSQNVEQVSVSENVEAASQVPQNVVEVSVSQNVEAALPVPRNVDEVSVSQNFESASPVPQNVEDVSVSQNVEASPVPRNLGEVLVSQNFEAALVSKNVEAATVSQNVEEVPISLNVEEVAVFQNVQGVPVSQNKAKVSVSQGVDVVPVSRNVEEVPASQRIDVVGSQRVEVVVSQRIDVVDSQHVDFVNSQPNDVLISEFLEQAVSQRIEVVSSLYQEGNVVPQYATQTESLVSQPVLQSCENSALQHVVIAHQPLSVPSILQSSIIPTPQPNANFTSRDGIHPYQINVSFPSHQGHVVSDRLENQHTDCNFNVSDNLGANSNFSSVILPDVTSWDYQHCPPSNWNHIPNGPSDSSTMLLPNAPSTVEFESGYSAGSMLPVGAAQTTPTFLEDETSMDSKPGSITNNNTKPLNHHFNEDEIEDNNDPRWEEIRCLKTDEERYASLLKRWGNVTMPNPRKNLTTHNYLVRNSQSAEARTLVFTNGRKRKASTGPVGERPGKRLCSLLDAKFADVERQTNQDLERLDGQRLFEINQVEQKREAAISDLVRAFGPNFLPDSYFNEIEFNTFQEKEQINNRFGKEMDDVWRRKNKATEELKRALNEMEAFYKFYGNESNAHLTPEEVDIFVEQEHMFSMYDRFYMS